MPSRGALKKSNSSGKHNQEQKHWDFPGGLVAGAPGSQFRELDPTYRN